MLFILIVEFKMRVPVLPGCICTPTTVYFYDKTKISKENLSSGLLFTAKYCTRLLTLLSLPGPNHLLNLTPKCRILSVFWTYIVRKNRIKNFNFFNWLSNVKDVVLYNGSKHVRIVIQWH